jgi:formate-dependent nitrite reductase cytochrome c552 subunit
MEFATCASAGCHNFHDNRALYEEFLVKNAAAPDILQIPRVPLRAMATFPTMLSAADHDAPALAADRTIVLEWADSAHARSAVNCSSCHLQQAVPDTNIWTDRPQALSCRSCHTNETEGFLDGKHGMRLSLALSAMSPAEARLPMLHGASERKLECTSCHGSHEFDTRRAAVDACLGCHADTHSVSYKASPHFALWRAEISGKGAAGSGVSCATCHLPREVHREGDLEAVRVQHNQNWNLEPNEKMIRDVCMSCHGLAFSIDALADPSLVNSNFQGRPSIHIQSIDMALKKAGR